MHQNEIQERILPVKQIEGMGAAQCDVIEGRVICHIHYIYYTTLLWFISSANLIQYTINNVIYVSLVVGGS